MLKLIRDRLQKIIDSIDAGTSSLSEAEALAALDYISKLTNREQRLSKYQAYKYLNVSRATFDNYVRAGKLPKGKKEAGWKELSWTKAELDGCLSRIRNNDKLNHYDKDNGHIVQ